MTVREPGNDDSDDGPCPVRAGASLPRLALACAAAMSVGRQFVPTAVVTSDFVNARSGLGGCAGMNAV
jgi:hypothetical protein